MSRWVAVLPLLLASTVARGDDPGAHRRLRPKLVPDLAIVSAWAPADVSRARSAPPPCIGDVCQPQVALPGREPHFSTQGKRTELVVSLLDRWNVEPLASVTRYLAATGLRVDLAPAQSAPGVDRGRRVTLVLRWKLDAMNLPMWLSRGRGRI